MKQIIIALLLSIPIMGLAKKTDDTKYLKGAVPEENGVITFSKSFSVQGKNQQEIRQTICSVVKEKIMAPAIDELRTRFVSDGAEDGIIVARVEEYMVFKSKPLYLDRTRFRYMLTAKVSENDVKMQISQISYYYNEDMEGKNGIEYKGEEWISDEEALNKQGTKLYPKSGKFRRKTVDRVEAIFQDIENAF